MDSWLLSSKDNNTNLVIQKLDSRKSGMPLWIWCKHFGCRRSWTNRRNISGFKNENNWGALLRINIEISLTGSGSCTHIVQSLPFAFLLHGSNGRANQGDKKTAGKQNDLVNEPGSAADGCVQGKRHTVRQPRTILFDGYVVEQAAVWAAQIALQHIHDLKRKKNRTWRFVQQTFSPLSVDTKMVNSLFSSRHLVRISNHISIVKVLLTLFEHNFHEVPQLFLFHHFHG
jgi:hypothetical protein